MENFKLGNELIKHKLISSWDYNKVLQMKKKSKKEILDILLEKKYLKREVLCKFIKNFFNIESINLKDIRISKEVLDLLPKDIAEKYNIIPFCIKDDKLCIATSNPFHEEILEDISFLTNKEVIPYLASKNKIKYALEIYYGNEVAKEALKNLKNKKVYNLNSHENLKKHEYKKIQTSPIVKLTNSIIHRAVNSRASDIHIEPFENTVNVRYRIDGVLKKISEIPIEIYPLVCSRIKTLSSMDISKKLIPQDGKMNLKINENKIDFRVSSIPTIHGEKLVIRILHKRNNNISLDFLSLDYEDKKLMKKILAYPHGIVLITGPTGSGKTTTLYAMINEINCEEKNIITIEDPVEYTMMGVNQVNVNYKSGLTFALGLRSILRQDPDVIMVGEIRDEETAKIAVKAAITGHLVFSTLHTNDASSVVERLINMNVASYLISDALIAVISQRLVRKICPYCKESYIPNEYEMKRLNITSKTKLYRGRGCRKCNNTGYIGRQGVFEIMYVDAMHKKMICENKSADDIRNYSVKNGMRFFKDRCRDLVLQGKTTFKEMMKIAYENV